MYFLLTMTKKTFLIGYLILIASGFTSSAGDLGEIKREGVLRHIGVPYANFVTGTTLSGEDDGFDVELIQGFAKYIGVRYEFKSATWDNLIPLLTGDKIKLEDAKAVVIGKEIVQGDIAACGITELEWRQGLVNFSDPIFPTQVWLISHTDSDLKPIHPVNIEADILEVKKKLDGRSLFCKEKTCLDPALYDLKKTGAKLENFAGTLNELAPAIINKEKELTLLDAPDTLAALQKWPGQIKVIGPINKVQNMAAAFAKSSPELRKVFNEYLAHVIQNGTYSILIKKYYPFVSEYFPNFSPFHKSTGPAITNH